MRPFANELLRQKGRDPLPGSDSASSVVEEEREASPTHAEPAAVEEAERKAAERLKELIANALATGELTAELEEAGYRQWELVAEGEKVIAILRDLKSSVCTLERLDGTQLQVKASDVSDSDRKYLTRWAKNRR